MLGAGGWASNAVLAVLPLRLLFDLRVVDLPTALLDHDSGSIRPAGLCGLHRCDHGEHMGLGAWVAGWHDDWALVGAGGVVRMGQLVGCVALAVALPNKRLQRTNAARESGIGAARRRGTVAFAAEVQAR